MESALFWMQPPNKVSHSALAVCCTVLCKCCTALIEGTVKQIQHSWSLVRPTQKMSMTFSKICVTHTAAFLANHLILHGPHPIQI